MMEMLTKLALWLVASFGHCWFWTSCVNFMYSLPWPDRVLDRCRKVHDLAILLGPLVLAYSLWQPGACPVSSFQGLYSSELYRFGWSALLLTPWVFAGLGLVLYLASRIRRYCLPTPKGYQLQSSRVLDVAAQLGTVPCGAGRYDKLVSVPGNQAFTVELNEKRFQFDRLPREFDQLRVLHLSDLHFSGPIDLPYFQAVLEEAQRWQPDLITVTGDLLDQLELTRWFPETLGKLTAPLGRYYILGNHDWHLDPEAIRQAMNQLGWQDCQGRCCEVRRDGASLWLTGDERPWMGEAPDYTGIPEQGFRLLLCHTPDLVEEARQNQVDLMLSGHNHGGQIKFPLIGAIYAPSRYGVLLTDGQFDYAPTTLHISRGLSGRHPIRLRCRPEVSLLILECR